MFRIIGFATARVTKACALVNRPGRHIVFGDFQENSAHTEAGKSSQMEVEELTAEPFAPRGGCNGTSIASGVTWQNTPR